MAGFLSSLFGSKPTVPTLTPLNLSTEQGKAIAGNQANLPASEALVGQSNTFTQQQITQMLSSAIPGYSNLVSAATGNIASELAGQLPADVRAQIQQSTAASAVAGGYSGGGMAGNLTARDLGLTSLNLTQQGLASAQSWMQEMNNLYSPGMMNVTSMFVSPAQQAAFDVQQQQQQFQAQWMQNQINAMPDPTTVGLWNTGWSVVDAALTAYTGQSVDLGRVSTQGSVGGVSDSVGGGGGGMSFGSSAAYGMGSQAVGYGPGAQVGYDQPASDMEQFASYV